MQISRQQRRASERVKEKRQARDAKATRLAAKRVAVASAWRRRHSLTGWQKLAVGFEMLFYVLGGPLVWWFHNLGWWLEKPNAKK
jgi:hypothetical protein